jgi:hypothetical protein
MEPLLCSQSERKLIRWLEIAVEASVKDEPPFSDHNATVLKGLVWISSLIDPSVSAASIGALGIFCFRKLPGIGARSSKVGNACVASLSRLGLAGVVQLTQLQAKVRYNTALRLIEKALNKTAIDLGISREDLEEIAVPSFGFDANGVLRQRFGDYTAEARLANDGSLDLHWVTGQGGSQRSVPAELKRNSGPALREFQKLLKGIPPLISAQAKRLEEAYVLSRIWRFADWNTRQLQHPILGMLGRRLIWEIGYASNVRSGIWWKGMLVDSSGQPLGDIDEQAEVRLWHPIGRSVEEVRRWRRFVSEHEITQPFKQAHREIYLLTEAENATRTYSNRFAGHVLRQHQFAALCRERGWKYTLQGQWDSFNTPTRSLPESKVRVDFHIAGADQAQVSTTAVFLYVSTDQVRFYPEDGDEPMPLQALPAMIFSELMRDIDLFVSVCSLGNDPAWRDRGEAGAYGGYWHDFSFGALSVTAQTRRDALAEILPKLAIANRCELDDRYLRVQGHLRTYKIHLGSANILMEPNDQYLCIVEAPQKSTGTQNAKTILLPFDDDHLLTVILSKALLLADDKKIKDSSILSQIRPQ